MKKTLVIAIVLVIAASMMLGCKNNRKDIDLKYSFVILGVSDGAEGSSQRKTYVNESLKDHMKEETLFGKTIELKYYSSIFYSSTDHSSNSIDKYRSEDGKYEYHYRNEPGKEETLTTIYAAGLKKAQNLNTEEDCLEMIKDLLGEFGISEEEISRFTLRCETCIRPYEDAGYYYDTYDGFKYAEKDGESLVERRFSFERFMGEYQYTAAACPKVIFDYRKMTDDAPTVRVYPGSKYIRDEIDKYDASEIDFTEIERELKIFVKDVTTNEEYTTTSVSIREKYVRIVDGKLTLSYTVSRNYNKTGAEMPAILDTVYVTP